MDIRYTSSHKLQRRVDQLERKLARLVDLNKAAQACQEIGELEAEMDKRLEHRR